MINPESLKNILLKIGMSKVALLHEGNSWVIEYIQSNKRKAYLYPNYDLGVILSKIHVANTKQELALVNINLVLPWNKNICVEALDTFTNSVDIYYVQAFSIKQIKAPIFNNLIPYVIKDIISKLNEDADHIADSFNLLNYQINVIENKDFTSYDEEGLDEEPPMGLF